ncbi:MAG: hypothetical protein K6F36_02505 [Bacilli bacterium]|nr:hypothetical protein [Bacilli bacterium]
MKKLTSAALLSLALLLSACGKPGESTPADTSAEATDSTAISSDSGVEESSVEEETLAQKVKNLFTTLATTNNGTYVSAGYFTEYHYEGGMFHLLDSSVRTSYWGYGEAKIDNYGIAQFGYTNDTMGVDADMCYIVSPNTSITYRDYNHVLADLGESGKNIEFTEASRSHTFSTNDAEFIQSLCDLDGLGFDGVADEFTTIKAYFNLTDDGKGFEKIGYSLKGSKSGYRDLEYANCSLTDIGTTKINTKVDAFLKTNPTFAPATSWDAETLSYIESQAPGFTLPFPSGTSYAYSMPADAEEGLIYSDLGCGNKNTAYGAVITGLGFTLDAQSSQTANGRYVYTKEIAQASGVHGAKTAVIATIYQSATGEAATFYPNGVWNIYFFVQQQNGVKNVSLADVNAEFASKKLLSNPSASILPTLTLTEGYTKIDFIDATDEFISSMKTFAAQYGVTISFSYCYCAEVHVYYPEASVDAAIASLGAQLIAAGYANAVDSTTGQTDPETFKLAADNTNSSTLIVNVEKAMTEATTTTPAAYKGFLVFAVTHYSIG